ncbi:hypothetical protein [Enterovirga sp.]|uniref:hypothetical protein n=1 Tax=Enterovirga sp. TaxID=2026350 RepID=UPI002C75A59E|nr:hypothetical protein [Enterovirga sp.]HMO30562.1 hypothetical protein [Enterovirga sp.]
MAVIPLPQRPGRAPAIAVRSIDHFGRPTHRREADRASLFGLLAGMAIVTTSVLGLLFYDRVHPIGSGAAPPAALVIAVEPMQLPADQPR